MDGLFASLALQENDLSEAARRLNQPYDTLPYDLQYQYYHNTRLEDLYRKRKILPRRIITGTKLTFVEILYGI